MPPHPLALGVILYLARYIVAGLDHATLLFQPFVLSVAGNRPIAEGISDPSSPFLEIEQSTTTDEAVHLLAAVMFRTETVPVCHVGPDGFEMAAFALPFIERHYQ